MYINYCTCTDTTDVQAITVDEESVSARIRCDFITGSNAQGCLVVVVVGDGKGSQTLTFNLTRQRNTSTAFKEIRSLVNGSNCYNVVMIFAYDIEEDGSVGNLAVPGRLQNGHTLDCSSQTNTSKLC